MAGRRVFKLNIVVFALILFSLVKSNSSERLGDNAESLHLTKVTTGLARKAPPLIDSNGKLGFGSEISLLRNRRDVFGDTEIDPSFAEEAVMSTPNEDKKIKKRFVQLLAIPFGQWLLGILGIGAAAVTATASQEIFGRNYNQGYVSNYHEISQPKNEKEPKSEQVTSNPRSGAHEEKQAPKVEDMHDDFKNLEDSKQLNKRKRWRDKKTGEYYEWQGSEGGHLEKYDRRGKNHKGGFDPYTGKRVKDPVPGREIDV